MQAVQGLLNYAPNGPNDGGLMLMKGSSKLFDEFFSQERTEADHVSILWNFSVTLSRTLIPRARIARLWRAYKEQY